MKRVNTALLALASIAAAVAASQGVEPFASWYAVLVCFAVTIGMLTLVQLSYHDGRAWTQDPREPQRLGFSWLDRLKLLVCFLDAFQVTYVVRPGLYYTGQYYDRDTPLLVTSNYLLTAFEVWRHVADRNVRILVVDTGGINVWCAAGKGRFSSPLIVDTLARYDHDLLSGAQRVELVLPKLGMAGVDLRALRKARIKPIMGPVLAKDLPAFLDAGKLAHAKTDQVDFGLRSRFFTMVPGLVQYVGYATTILLAMLALEWGTSMPAPRWLVGVFAMLGLLYPMLFPWIPGRRFAVKGLWLGGALAALLVGLGSTGLLSWLELLAALPFTLGAGAFVGLTYTGNSAVSNYSSVRRETARFLPVVAVLFAVSFVAWMTGGMIR